MSELSPAVRNLMAMRDEVVSARHIAPVLKMSESVLVYRVKNGQWDQEQLGKVVVSGNRVKFFREDFLRKCGFLPPEKPERTTEDMLAEVIELIRVQNLMLMEISAYIKKDRRQEQAADGMTGE